MDVYTVCRILPWSFIALAWSALIAEILSNYVYKVRHPAWWWIYVGCFACALAVAFAPVWLYGLPLTPH